VGGVRFFSSFAPAPRKHIGSQEGMKTSKPTSRKLTGQPICEWTGPESSVKADRFKTPKSGHSTCRLTLLSDRPGVRVAEINVPGGKLWLNAIGSHKKANLRRRSRIVRLNRVNSLASAMVKRARYLLIFA
jgi:hypothetical protein